MLFHGPVMLARRFATLDVLSQDKVFRLYYPKHRYRYDILEVHLCYQPMVYSLSVLTSIQNSVLILPANHFRYELSMLSKPLYTQMIHLISIGS